MTAGVGVAGVDRSEQDVDGCGLPVGGVKTALQRFTLQHVADDPREHIEKLQLAVAQPGICAVAGGAQHAVEDAVRETQRDRDERANVSGLGDRQRRRAIIGPHITDQLRQAALQNPLTVSVLPGERLALAKPERIPIPSYRPKDLAVRGQLADERDLHPKKFTDRINRPVHRHLTSQLRELKHPISTGRYLSHDSRSRIRH